MQNGELVLCKNWVKKGWGEVEKAWDRAAEFAKEHVTEVVVVGGCVVGVGLLVLAAILCNPPAGALGAALVAPSISMPPSSSSKTTSESSSSCSDFYHPVPPSSDTSLPPPPSQIPGFREAFHQQSLSFKGVLAEQDFFTPPPHLLPHETLSLQERTKVLGTLFADHTMKHLVEQSLAPRPGYPNTIQTYPEASLLITAHQRLGQEALYLGYPIEALHHFNQLSQLEPAHTLHREIAVAYLVMGDSEAALKEVHQHISKASLPVSIFQFVSALPKGLNQGSIDSVKEIGFFTKEVITEPIHTGVQIYEAFCLLKELVESQEWKLLGKTLVPEAASLLKEWDILSPLDRGERAGYVFGKYGTDILLMTVTGKVSPKTFKAIQKLKTVRRELKTVEQIFALETASAMKQGGEVAEGTLFVFIQKNLSCTIIKRKMAKCCLRVRRSLINF